MEKETFKIKPVTTKLAGNSCRVFSNVISSLSEVDTKSHKFNTSCFYLTFIPYLTESSCINGAYKNTISR